MKLLFLVISILFLSTLAQEFNQGFINYTVWTSTQFCGGTVYRYNEIEPSPHVVGYTTRNVDSILVLVCNATLQPLFLECNISLAVNGTLDKSLISIKPRVCNDITGTLSYNIAPLNETILETIDYLYYCAPAWSDHTTSRSYLVYSCLNSAPTPTVTQISTTPSLHSSASSDAWIVYFLWIGFVLLY